jgi:hypothetical protein
MFQYGIEDNYFDLTLTMLASIETSPNPFAHQWLEYRQCIFQTESSTTSRPNSCHPFMNVVLSFAGVNYGIPQKFADSCCSVLSTMLMTGMLE